DGREYYQWLGIPYAKPPVGELRFASPKAVKPWDTVRVTSSYGSWCAQTYVFMFLQFGHEDCLFLNVNVPKIDDDKAAFTQYQMLSPQTKGLFQKTIALSGTAGSSSWSFSPAEKAHYKSKQIAEFFQCPTESPALLTKCLQRVPASEMLSSVKNDVVHLV
ncbi:unnamed protein product, partial [Allacma fusca]